MHTSRRPTYLGYKVFRGDLAVMYFITLDPVQGKLVDLRLIPMQVRHFRLNHASPRDARWLCDTLNREGARFGTQLRLNADHSMSV
jgi:poly-gamma-glutamate capsule biosynthesis protein CapA/YwtB (metallophosphatase superfamily)